MVMAGAVVVEAQPALEAAVQVPEPITTPGDGCPGKMNSRYSGDVSTSHSSAHQKVRIM
jgi:hypothetical protein